MKNDKKPGEANSENPPPTKKERIELENQSTNEDLTLRGIHDDEDNVRIEFEGK